VLAIQGQVYCAKKDESWCVTVGGFFGIGFVGARVTMHEGGIRDIPGRREEVFGEARSIVRPYTVFVCANTVWRGILED
jgi:hypothetical protein